MGFHLNTFLVSALAATSYASPLIQARASNTSYTNSNGLKFNQFNASLPNVTLLATGTYHTLSYEEVSILTQIKAAPSPAQATIKPQQQATNPAHYQSPSSSAGSQKSTMSPTSPLSKPQTSIAAMSPHPSC
jgi:hypothetical protein